MRRPHIPLKTRLAVLERMAFVDKKYASPGERAFCLDWYKKCHGKQRMKERIRILTSYLFDGAEVELDHDPALVLRKFNKRTGRYSPSANDPNYLVYRVKEDHLHKSTGRAPGAERTVTSKGSDTWLAKKWRKLERPSKRSKSKIASRPFPKRRTSTLKHRSSFARHVGGAS